MKKKLISTLICAVFTFTLIGTSLPAYAVEESVNSQEKEKPLEDEDNLSYGNTELTEDDYKWMEENMENKTSEIFQKAYGDKASNKKVRVAFFNYSEESPLPQSKD